MAKISLELDRKDVAVSDLADAMRLQVRLVEQAMAVVGIASSDVRWVITSLDHGSAMYTGESQILSDRVFNDALEAAVLLVGTGMQRLASVGAMPDRFSEEMLNTTKRFTEIVAASDAGKARIGFGSLYIDRPQSVREHIDAINRQNLHSIGSIEGVLVGVSLGDGRYRIAIKDRLRGRRTPCTISADLLPRALTAFEKRVTARGLIRSRSDGSHIHIEVRQLEEMKPDSELPDLSDVRGILRDYRIADGE
jgi:hypothetical protein